ncbi:PREDICTED: lysophospholipid acyltransferase LPEAT1-like isoform X2 [Erythranthe guttata]|uniref:lysophospholipid acyltransferase LPEAT1-like isoform X2 n=1 Tax=Erythranthe guttata TaxID=4155 RepID=UPI00064D80E6|nr:PREDICTED: lysophospholipid acyltransferase LPEAT1-like isoform X2 [Erythranthe guttata]|eukprot:XP_012845757.1 PREDICTED: lysophospholipid acyltransferase LPEAT1-like isoform X2 [Erythranthe guttata]
MESELKSINPQPADQQPEPEPDDSPLLKSDPKTPEPETQIPVSSQTIEEMEQKYAAYVRHDVYGTMGRAELPLTEKILLGLGLVLLLPIRVVAGTIVLVSYYLICRVCTAFLAPNTEDEQEDYAHMGGWRRAVIIQSGRFLSRVLLFVFGFYWIVETRRNNEIEEQLDNETTSGDQSQTEDLERPGAIISNHVSYLDILYHMSSSFPSFVAKRSVAKLPLVGLISKCLGCVYVQRELKASNFKGVSGVVNDRIREAHQSPFAPKMMLFPEGTTTNGDYLLPFKTGAFLAKAPVLPVILRYPYHRFSPAWDSISGVRHVVLLLSQFVNHIEVTRLPVYHPSEQEREDPKLYAENVRKLMSHEGNLIRSDIGLPEKRIYHAALNGLFSQR